MRCVSAVLSNRLDEKGVFASRNGSIVLIGAIPNERVFSGFSSGSGQGINDAPVFVFKTDPAAQFLDVVGVNLSPEAECFYEATVRVLYPDGDVGTFHTGGRRDD